MEVKYNMPTIKVGSKYLSGLHNMDERLWNQGYIVSVFMGCFILYEPPFSRKNKRK